MHEVLFLTKLLPKYAQHCAGKSTGKTLFELFSVSRQGKGLVSHFPQRIRIICDVEMR